MNDSIWVVFVKIFGKLRPRYKTIWTILSFQGLFLKKQPLKGQYGPNRLVSWSEFNKNFSKYNPNRTICAFDKD